MRVEEIPDPHAFLELATPLLAADEARHNLVLGLAATLARDPARYDEFHLWVVRDGATVAGAALWTPPFELALARPSSTEALEALVAHLAGRGVPLPGVVGADPEAGEFARSWTRRTGATASLRMAQRIHRLTHVRPVADVPGRMRTAMVADRDLLLDWSFAFAAEAGTHADPEQLRRGVEERLAGDGEGFSAPTGYALWEDGGRSVSLAGWAGPTPTGVRVGPVYTPPELRRRGYASALVAGLSAGLLAAGRRHCFLFTDLANPTANHIYAEVGYEPVCDAPQYAFERPVPG